MLLLPLCHTVSVFVYEGGGDVYLAQSVTYAQMSSNSFSIWMHDVSAKMVSQVSAITDQWIQLDFTTDFSIST